MKSISGHCIFCYGNLVQWSSKRQTLTAGSTMQSELIAASSAADASVWFYTLQEHFPVLFGAVEGKPAPVPLLVDNKACLSVANHPMSTPRTRHICLREFRIRDYAEAGQIRPFWVPGTHNCADFFTKPLAKTLFQRFLGPLGMRGQHMASSPFPSLSRHSKKPKTKAYLATEFFDNGSGVKCWHTHHDWSSPSACFTWRFHEISKGDFPSKYTIDV